MVMFLLFFLTQATQAVSSQEAADKLLDNLADYLFHPALKAFPFQQMSLVQGHHGYLPAATQPALRGVMQSPPGVAWLHHFQNLVDARSVSSKSGTTQVQDRIVAPDAVAIVDKESTAARRSMTFKQPPTLKVLCLGISIHKSDVSVREQVAIKMDDWVPAAQELVAFSQGAITEAAVLSTCNRFELYVACEKSRTVDGETAVMRWLEQRSGLSETKLRDNLFVLQHEDAVSHLLQVSAGLDSLIVGEGQILSQVGACHQAAIGVGGQGGKVLARLLNQAVQSGKRVREKTGLTKGAVSISSAAIEFAKGHAPLDLHKPLKETSVAVVGAGKMARLLLVHLKSAGVTRVVVCNGNIGEGSRAAALVDEFGADMDVVLRPLPDMYDVITETDMTFLATAATDPIVTRAGLGEALSSAHRETPLVLVDICVPRNVEQEVESLPNIFSYNVDALKEVVAKNTEARRGEMIKAQAMLDQDKKQWLTWHTSLAAVPVIRKLQEHAEIVRQAELSKYADEIAHLDAKNKDKVEKFTSSLIKSLMQQPMTHLNKPATPDEKQRTIGEFNSLFEAYEDRETGRKEEAVQMLELLSEKVKTADQDLGIEEEGSIARGIASAPADLQRARAREKVAELRVIEKLSCGILEATMQTLDFLEGRAEAIRVKSEAAELKEAAADAIDAKQCPIRERAPTAYDRIKEGLSREREAEAKELDRISMRLAEASMETVARIQARAESIRERELSKNAKKLKSLTNSEAELVDKISRGIVNGLMAGPASHLFSPQDVEEKSLTLDTFAGIWGVPAEDKQALADR